MFIYGDNEHRIGAWNAVDVLVDGRLQHGDVINVADGGLIIDFGCSAQRAQFVEYGRVFCCDGDFSYGAHRPGDTVLVLLRQHPDAPWTWYPGTIASLGEYDPIWAPLVEVRLPDGRIIRELVPVFQIREQPTDERLTDLRVEPEDFVVRSCPLPAVYWAEGSQAVRQIFQCRVSGRRNRVLCISVFNQTLVYLQYTGAAPLTTKQLEKVYKGAMKETPDSCSPATLQWIRRHLGSGALNDAGWISLHDDAAVSGREVAFPIEMWLEIFQTLDTIGRVRCRRVCQLWNNILTNGFYATDLRVSGNSTVYGADCFPQHMYWVVNCLLKCLRPRTEKARIDGLDLDDCEDLIKLIKQIRRGNRIPVLELDQCRFGDDRAFVGKLVERMARLAVAYSGLGESVVWKDFTLQDHSFSAAVKEYAFKDASFEGVQLQLWEVFESNLVLERPLDGQGIAGWIADCIAQQRQETLQQIVRALNWYQSPDPRASTHYRQQEWTLSTLGEVDVNRLTTLTVAALQEVKEPLVTAQSGFVELVARLSQS
ncbi:uncharacterized protein LOC129596601 [Paramacrobiotus metropolitanus]|uniref:uncharacterized protein LOC129596601 n=1 Tax=Paramacrobiotus metropolitanus TaxID=2943436 RepID=UPI002445B597|nr:uncharacterized protein LOC129596601 [Paramacrobiotus metropolitanus]